MFVMFEYHATIRRVVDGDTVDVDLDLGFKNFRRERVRLLGIDTPESRTRDKREKRWGKVAAARLSELLPVGETFPYHSQEIDKYGRSLGNFTLPFSTEYSSQSAVDVLLRERLGVPYAGQSKAAVRAAHEANWDYLEANDD